MQEIHIEYMDENGELQSHIRFIDDEMATFIEALRNDADFAEEEMEYWKRMFNMHITRGVMVN